MCRWAEQSLATRSSFIKLLNEGRSSICLLRFFSLFLFVFLFVFHLSNYSTRAGDPFVCSFFSHFFSLSFIILLNKGWWFICCFFVVMLVCLLLSKGLEMCYWSNYLTNVCYRFTHIIYSIKAQYSSNYSMRTGDPSTHSILTIKT